MSIFTEFKQLSVNEKVQVLQDLWDQIAESPDQLPVPEWHKTTLDQRKREWESSQDPGEDWDDVKCRLRENL
ncbi:MAG: addiction module protein [Acidobacteria bacterium]|nr:addiction module protein [Acidobacteriota bacterium]